MLLYRSMKVSGQFPLVEQSANGLGVRVGVDITPDDAGAVRDGTGGMSVAPDDPQFLHPHRRPPEFGGTGKHPVWEIHRDHLGEDLGLRHDKLEHAMVEPVGAMPLEQYEGALATTQESWRLARPSP